jgi:precorrin-6B C5,15-methyltransferase / cobalt-precorrin-6B C5,C15-methyltransferase
MAPEPVVIIGVGLEGQAGLSPAVREKIGRADELWGSDRLLRMWPDGHQKKVRMDHQIATVVQGLKLRPADRRVVILASGDPGFYGVAASVLRALPVEEVVIHPQASWLQAAFARIGVCWNDAALTSAHARPIAEVIGLARRYPKVGILTDPKQTPALIAEKLLAAEIPDCRAIVLENIGAPEEKIIESRLRALPGQTFAPLNALILVHDPDWRPLQSLKVRPDEAYAHKKGLITKQDVRTLCLSRMGLRESDIIWDIGAGSGALSIEMAELAWRGRVFAVEKNAECLACLRTNVQRFGLLNVEIIAAAAPDGLPDLPAPDAVFIGGSDGKLEPILLHIAESTRSTCRVVANFALLENLLSAYHWLQEHGWQPELTEAQFSYGTPLGSGTRLAPANPVFILSGTCTVKGDA